MAERLGAPAKPLTGAMVTHQLAEAVPFYAGLTLEEIGGTGVRWAERDAASAAGQRRPRPPIASSVTPA